MSDLDLRQRDSEVPMSENGIQYAYDKYNEDPDLMRSIKKTPEIYKRVKQANLEYKKAKDRRAKENEQDLPIVTAEDVRREMYR